MYNYVKQYGGISFLPPRNKKGFIMKRKTIINIGVIALLAALFIALSFIVDNNSVGRFVDADGNIMSQEDVAQYIADGGDAEELGVVE